MGAKELGNYLFERIGRGKLFSSARQMALAAGRHERQVIKIDEGIEPTPATVRDLALKALVENPAKLYVILDWLTEAEVEDYTPTKGLMPEEVELLQAWRRLSPDQRTMLLAAARQGARQPQARQQPRAAEDRRGYNPETKRR